MSKNIRLAALAATALAGPAMALETKDAGNDPAPNDTTEIKTALVDLGAAVKEHRDAVDAELKELKKGGVTPETESKLTKLNDEISDLSKKVDDLRLDAKRPETTGADGRKREMTETELKHREAMVAYMRKGDASGYEADELKALSAGSDPDGGYTIIPELDRNCEQFKH